MRIKKFVLLIIAVILTTFLYGCSKQIDEKVIADDVDKTAENITGDVIQHCIETFKVQEAAKYARGHILVGFDDISVERQKAVLSSFGLESEGRDPNIKSSILYEVSVPKGSEIRWICTLKMQEGVKYASLDQIIYMQSNITESG